MSRVYLSSVRIGFIPPLETETRVYLSWASIALTAAPVSLTLVSQQVAISPGLLTPKSTLTLLGKSIGISPGLLALAETDIQISLGVLTPSTSAWEPGGGGQPGDLAIPTLELSEGPEDAKALANATNESPIECTVYSHGFEVGDELLIENAVGNTNVNGVRLVKEVIAADTFTIQDAFGRDVAGNGTFTGIGATVQRWKWTNLQGLMAKTSGRYGRLRLVTNGTMQILTPGQLRVSVVTRREAGTVQTASSGPTIVSFANRYAKAVAAVATASGSDVPLYCVTDSLEVDGGRGVGVGQSLLFDGIDDYVEIADSTPLRLADRFTVEALIQVTAVTGVVQNIVRKDTETGTNYSWGLRISTTGRLQAYYHNASGSFVATSVGPVSLGNWHRVGLVISDFADEFEHVGIYLDGMLVQISAAIAGTQGIPTGRLGIGARPPTNYGGGLSWGEWYGGRIDDVRIWNVVRTADEQKSMMATPLQGDEPGLVGYWKFDSLTGTTAIDSTANANDGTVSGARWRPLNGMDLYAFDPTTGLAVPDRTVSWIFDGV